MAPLGPLSALLSASILLSAMSSMGLETLLTSKPGIYEASMKSIELGHAKLCFRCWWPCLSASQDQYWSLSSALPCICILHATSLVQVIHAACEASSVGPALSVEMLPAAAQDAFQEAAQRQDTLLV